MNRLLGADGQPLQGPNLEPCHIDGGVEELDSGDFEINTVVTVPGMTMAYLATFPSPTDVAGIAHTCGQLVFSLFQEALLKSKERVEEAEVVEETIKGNGDLKIESLVPPRSVPTLGQASAEVPPAPEAAEEDSHNATPQNPTTDTQKSDKESE